MEVDKNSAITYQLLRTPYKITIQVSLTINKHRMDDFVYWLWFEILFQRHLHFHPKKDNNTPAATADPITPATFGPIACINK